MMMKDYEIVYQIYDHEYKLGEIGEKHIMIVMADSKDDAESRFELTVCDRHPEFAKNPDAQYRVVSVSRC